MNKQQQTQTLTLKMMIGLAAPHTWVASVIPALFGGAFAWRQQGTLNLLLFGVLILICVLMQSAVNTFNDYYDFVGGNDSKEDFVEENDAVLVHANVAPKQALYLGTGFLIAACVLGIYPIFAGGWPVLATGLLGGLILLGYSGWKYAFSRLPVGEVLSGFTMGGLIPLGCVSSLTGVFQPTLLFTCIPLMIAIGLIMMTNNTCDIERDKKVRRRTMPVLVGRNNGRYIYRTVMALWLIALGLCCFTHVPETAELKNVGVILLWSCFGVIVTMAGVQWFRQMKCSLEAQVRPAAMKGIVKLNALMGVSYILWMIL